MEKEKRNKPVFKSVIQMVIIHLTPLLLLWSGLGTKFDWGVLIFMYFARMFFVTGGYHRYFAHKTYNTSRFFQFLIAFCAQTTVQKGALWWASEHRVHHKHSDKPSDPHSNKIYGFFYSHIGWIIGPDFKKTHYEAIRDFAKFPELVWLNKNHLIPAIITAFGVFFLGGYVHGGEFGVDFFEKGLPTLVIGFFISTLILFHGTFSINSLSHMIGGKRYETGDESRNSFVLALVTMGEGWHNNHHYYQASARQGFFWWEIDITYYLLKTLSFLGLIWDLRPVPNYIKHSKNWEDAKRLQAEAKAAK